MLVPSHLAGVRLPAVAAIGAAAGVLTLGAWSVTAPSTTLPEACYAIHEAPRPECPGVVPDQILPPFDPASETAFRHRRICAMVAPVLRGNESRGSLLGRHPAAFVASAADPGEACRLPVPELATGDGVAVDAQGYDRQVAAWVDAGCTISGADDRCNAIQAELWTQAARVASQEWAVFPNMRAASWRDEVQVIAARVQRGPAGWGLFVAMTAVIWMGLAAVLSVFLRAARPVSLQLAPGRIVIDGQVVDEVMAAQVEGQRVLAVSGEGTRVESRRIAFGAIDPVDALLESVPT